MGKQLYVYKETCYSFLTELYMCQEKLSVGLLHIRGIFDVITAWQQGVWSIMAGIFKIRVNNTNVGNFGKKIKCTVL